MQCGSLAGLVLLGECMAVPISHSDSLILGIYQLMMICILTKIWPVWNTDSLHSVEPKCPFNFNDTRLEQNTVQMTLHSKCVCWSVHLLVISVFWNLVISSSSSLKFSLNTGEIFAAHCLMSPLWNGLALKDTELQELKVFKSVFKLLIVYQCTGSRQAHQLRYECDLGHLGSGLAHFLPAKSSTTNFAWVTGRYNDMSVCVVWGSYRCWGNCVLGCNTI